MSEIITAHPLVKDLWLNDDEPEHSSVHSTRIANVTRAADGIRAISRLVHNSLGEPSMSGAQPLGHATHMELLDALYCLGDYLFDQGEAMRETAALHEQFNRDREAAHG